MIKVVALIAGMIAGADSIGDMHLLRHGAMGRIFSAVRAPSTLGTFLRAFSWGHVRQLDAVAARFLVALTEQVPVLAGADKVAFLDIYDTIKATYGYQKEGALFDAACGPQPQAPDHPTPIARRTNPRGRTGQTGHFLTPKHKNPAVGTDQRPSEPDRWIEAQSARGGRFSTKRPRCAN